MPTPDHDWEDCPHTFAEVDPRKDVDLTKSNHFFHDSAGCPGECLADHNHPNVIFAQ